MLTKFAAAPILVGVVLLSGVTIKAAGQQAQRSLPVPDAMPAPHRTRLILKDGSYQVVMRYRVAGNRVRFLSAERGGVEEEIPTELVDFAATERWEKQHTAPAEGEPGAAPVIDPELLKEEADRAALTPEVAKDLRLPEVDSALLLDEFHGTPELVPLMQTDGDLNRNTGHTILKAAINPLASSHQIVQLKGERSAVQVHVDTPTLFLRIGEATTASGGAALTVDTHGASGQAPSVPLGGGTSSHYVIVRADVRTGARVVASFKINLLGGVKRQEDIVETTTELLPGGHWIKVTPKHPLEFGEYAVMEVLSEREVNLGVWDFGVHPMAPESREAIKPEARRPITLERRRPQ